MPKVQYRSNCKPSTFAYPPALEIPKEKEKEKVGGGAQLGFRAPQSCFSVLLLSLSCPVISRFQIFALLLCFTSAEKSWMR